MARSNENLAGAGKAIDAHQRNQDRPENADHFPLKDENGQPKMKSDQD